MSVVVTVIVVMASDLLSGQFYDIRRKDKLQITVLRSSNISQRKHLRLKLCVDGGHCHWNQQFSVEKPH